MPIAKPAHWVSPASVLISPLESDPDGSMLPIWRVHNAQLQFVTVALIGIVTQI